MNDLYQTLEIENQIIRLNVAGGQHHLSPPDVIHKQTLGLASDSFTQVVKVVNAILVALLAAPFPVLQIQRASLRKESGNHLVSNGGDVSGNPLGGKSGTP
jgi:hypothetical protein